MTATRRLNFFKGLFTSADDWKTEQSYHVEKQRMHNTQLHVPGIVSGLEIKPSASGTAVQVSAGHLIDPTGRDLHLDVDVQREIQFDEYTEPTPIFVVLEYQEKGADKRPNAANPPDTDYAFIEEDPKLSIMTKVPKDALALATIKLNPAAGKRIREANDPANPKDNELDFRVRQRAGAIGARTSLRDAATVAQAGITQIGAHKDGGATEYEASVTWPAQGESHSFHFASVYPVDGEGEVSWRMGCLREKGELKYRLFIRNHEPREMKVAYRVYRLD